jgi:hypothetical protein
MPLIEDNMVQVSLRLPLDVARRDEIEEIKKTLPPGEQFVILLTSPSEKVKMFLRELKPLSNDIKAIKIVGDDDKAKSQAAIFTPTETAKQLLRLQAYGWIAEAVAVQGNKNERKTAL